MAKSFYRIDDIVFLDDLNEGDIIEVEVGVFTVSQGVGGCDGNRLLTETLYMIPETDNYDRKSWDSEITNFFLDLMIDDCESSDCYLEIIKYIKKNYSYEQFRKIMEELRE